MLRVGLERKLMMPKTRSMMLPVIWRKKRFWVLFTMSITKLMPTPVMMA